jgi:hypothetical protein
VTGSRTPIGEVEVAARAAGVYAATLQEQFVVFGEPVPCVVMVAHGGPWLLYVDPGSVLGWVAEQAIGQDDGSYVPMVPVTAGWLGASDLEAERVVANLLDAEELPTDLFRRQPPISTRRQHPGDRP